jgi:hypothetical protein
LATAATSPAVRWPNCPGQNPDGALTDAIGCDIVRVIFHGVVQQGRACHVR